MEEVWDVLQAGSSSRTVGSTRANDHSSRSHWCVNVNRIACISAWCGVFEWRCKSATVEVGVVESADTLLLMGSCWFCFRGTACCA